MRLSAEGATITGSAVFPRQFRLKKVYLEHFGLRELPFTLSPNTEFFMELDGHREAMALVIHALQEGHGHIQLSGEAGTGKTLLCRRLLQIFDENILFACIPNPFLSP